MAKQVEKTAVFEQIVQSVLFKGAN